MKVDILNMKWRAPSLPTPAALALSVKLGRVLREWAGTPYMPGQQCKGAGTDCVRFVCAVLDETFDLGPTPIATLPPDASLHNRLGAIAAMKRICELYPHVAIEDGSLEPGDVLVVGPTDGGPGHAMLVGHRLNELWQAAAPMVHRTGLGIFGTHQRIFRVYRMVDEVRLKAVS